MTQAIDMPQAIDRAQPGVAAADRAQPGVTTDTDLVSEIQEVLRNSAEPLTISKIRAALPASLRSIGSEALTEVLQRQAAANVLVQYPKYRSPQDRFWDRPMPVHIATLLRAALEEGALELSKLRRKLPGYAQQQAEAILQEQLSQGRLYRYPRAGRGKERFGVRPPDPKEYLRTELVAVFARLEQLGFKHSQLRESALELLHEEEWASPPPKAVPAPVEQQPAAEPPAPPLVEANAPAESLF